MSKKKKRMDFFEMYDSLDSETRHEINGINTKSAFTRTAWQDSGVTGTR